MKILVVIVLAFSTNIHSFGQEEEMSKKMPPIKMLPKNGEKATFYELPEKTDYKIYNQSGQLIQEGNAEFINITHFKKGDYFIVYEDKKKLFSVKE